MAEVTDPKSIIKEEDLDEIIKKCELNPISINKLYYLGDGNFHNGHLIINHD
jgi:hypothetical protein